jgi:hypothetical protein
VVGTRPLALQLIHPDWTVDDAACWLINDQGRDPLDIVEVTVSRPPGRPASRRSRGGGTRGLGGRVAFAAVLVVEGHQVGPDLA